MHIHTETGTSIEKQFISYHGLLHYIIENRVHGCCINNQEIVMQ
jgi:hypothetical protein